MELLGYRLDSAYEGKMMVLDLCAENYLFVEGDKVKGNITKNRLKRSSLKKQFYKLVLNEQAYGNWFAKRKKYPRSKRYMQVMSLTALKRKLHRRSSLQ